MAKNRQNLLTTGFTEFVKQHIVYDIGGRMIEVYETRTDAQHGEGCVFTRFSYDGTSNRVVFMKEDEATWDSAWDV